MTALEFKEEDRSVWKYSPLEDGSDQIRILALQPGNGSETISCEQVIVSLQDAMKYEALSYAWGSLKTTHSILFEGQLFPVTKSLHSALQHLRHKDEPRYVWIDALCIDQLNNKEKSAQVQLMGDIYKRASKVLAWLGEAEDDSDLDLDFLNKRDRIFDDMAYSSELPVPPTRPFKHYAKNPNKSCKMIIDINGYATLIQDEDSDNGPRVRMSVPEMTLGGSINQTSMDRLFSEQIRTATRVFSQDDTILLPLNEQCRQCEDQGGPCWWNKEDQCVSCLTNLDMTSEPCSLLTLHGQCPEILDTGRNKRLIPDRYAYLAGVTALPVRAANRSGDQNELPRMTERLWLALFQFTNRTWWNRTWILQEVAVNESDPVIMCGERTTTLKAIEDFTSSTMAEAAIPTPIGARWADFMGCTRTFTEIRKKIRESSTMSLVELLEISGHLESSDPRDKVFALLNLALPEDRLRCKADYSLPVTEVYARTALHIIRTTRKLTILGFNTAVSGALPSWVPDWSLGRKSRTPLSKGARYSASKNLATQTLHPPSTTTLTVRGFSISHVSHVSDPISTQGIWPAFSLSAFAAMLDPLEGLIFDAMRAYIVSDEAHADDNRSKRTRGRFFRLFPEPRISDTFWRTLVCNSHLCSSGPGPWLPAPAYWAELFELLRDSSYENSEGQSPYQAPRQYARELSGGESKIPHLETPSPIEIPEDFQPELPVAERIAEFARPLLMQMALKMEGRRLFVMESGHMGLTTAAVREGDQVHILLGGDVPYILRKKAGRETSGGALQLIGEAYVHEFMHGEWLGPASYEDVVKYFPYVDIE